jgi:hypothetical protein
VTISSSETLSFSQSFCISQHFTFSSALVRVSVIEVTAVFEHSNILSYSRSPRVSAFSCHSVPFRASLGDGFIESLTFTETYQHVTSLRFFGSEFVCSNSFRETVHLMSLVAFLPSPIGLASLFVFTERHRNSLRPVFSHFSSSSSLLATANHLISIQFLVSALLPSKFLHETVYLMSSVSFVPSLTTRSVFLLFTNAHSVSMRIDSSPLTSSLTFNSMIAAVVSKECSRSDRFCSEAIPQSDQSFAESSHFEASLSVDVPVISNSSVTSLISIDSSNSSVSNSFLQTRSRTELTCSGLLDRSNIFLNTFKFPHSGQKNPESPPHGLSDKVKVSVGVWTGVALALLVLVSAVGLFVWWLRRRREAETLKEDIESELEMDRYHEEEVDRDSLSDFCHESFGDLGMIAELWDDSLNPLARLDVEEGFI